MHVIYMCPVAEKSTKALGTKPKLRSKRSRRKAVSSRVLWYVTKPLWHRYAVLDPLQAIRREIEVSIYCHLHISVLAKTQHLDMVVAATYEYTM